MPLNIFFKDISCLIFINSVDPDEMQHIAAFHRGRHCVFAKVLMCAQLPRFNMDRFFSLGKFLRLIIVTFSALLIRSFFGHITIILKMYACIVRLRLKPRVQNTQEGHYHDYVKRVN